MPRPTCIITLRLSRDSDDSTSVASQRQTCEAYAAARDWNVILVTEDVDVSGATRLEDRPGMARALEAMPQADFVLAAKLDRYARSVLEFSRLLKHAEDAGTLLVTADGTLAPDTSKLVVHVLSAFAEYERDMIATRIRNSKAHLRTMGRWLGGTAPYGYQRVRRDGGVYLDIEPESAANLRECVRRVLEDGASLTQLVHELNRNGVPSPADRARIVSGREPRGARWTTSTLRDVMISPATRGWLLREPGDGSRRGAANNRAVLDDHGEPVRVGPELLDGDTHAAIVAKLEARSLGSGVSRTGKALLLHVAVCGVCEAPMYHMRRIVRGQDFSSYICRDGARRDGHAGNTVNVAGAEHETEKQFLTVLGRFNLMKEVPTGGRDVARELRETELAIEQLTGNLANLPPGGRAAQTVIQQLTALDAKHTTLSEEAAVPAGVEYVPVGRTIAEEWHRRDTDGRNELLREFGVRTTVHPYQPGTPRRFSPDRVTVEIQGPRWFREYGDSLVEPDD